VIGILILAAGAVCSYTAKEKLKSGGMTPEEEAVQRNIYAVSKIISMAGFIIAIIPSVKILQKEMVKKNTQPDKSDTAEIQKTDRDPSQKNMKKNK